MTPEAGAAPPAIELIGIDKSFGPVHANKNVNLLVERGVIHGIVGENGAGKSTLMSILYGFYEADAGEIRVNGEPVRIRSSREAIACGIGMVHQHFMLVPPLSVLENVMLGAEGGALLARGASAIRKRLAELGREYGLEVDPDAIVGELSVGLQQRVEILKALVRGAEILVLDEPTAVLTPSEADQLFEMLRVLKSQNKTIIFITHKLREIMSLTDRVSVMRRGEMVATFDTAATSPPELADAMVGRKVILKIDKGPAHPGKVALEARDLVVRDDRGVARVDDVSFALREGEILGVAGVAGNGQSELLEALAGIRPLSVGRDPDRRRAAAAGAAQSARRAADRRRPRAGGPPSRRPRHAVRGLRERDARLPLRDRSTAGASSTTARRSSPTPTARWRPSTSGPARRCSRPPISPAATSRSSCWRARSSAIPKIMLVGQPTRGVDIGAIEFIHKRIVAQRDAGKAVLLVSVELDEIFALVRPHHRAVRRAHHRRAEAGGDQRPGPRPADGRRQRARRMSAPLKPLPAWADVALIPLVNVAAAFVISGFVVLAIGENPLEAVQILITGALGDLEGIGFTLYYATSFIFTGLAVALCFHAGPVQHRRRGAGLYRGPRRGARRAPSRLPARLYAALIAAIIAAALFGAAFAAIPGYLQAKRDSHIVITTIMFNYIASAIMGYLLVDVLRVPGQMNAETLAISAERPRAAVPRGAGARSASTGR